MKSAIILLGRCTTFWRLLVGPVSVSRCCHLT